MRLIVGAEAEALGWRDDPQANSKGLTKTEDGKYHHVARDCHVCGAPSCYGVREGWYCLNCWRAR